MRKRICISKYKEDINWVKDLEGFDIIVYNKDNDIDIEKYDIKSDPYYIDDVKYIDIPNVGREAHTYLYHLVNNYEDLYDYEVFSQGNPLDHSPNIVNKLKKLNYGYNHLSDMTKDEKLSYYINAGRLDDDGNILQDNYSHFGHINELNNEIFNKNIPFEYTIGLHALFYCDKDTILKNTLETYIKCFNKFDINKYQINKGGGNGIVDVPNGENFPYIFELYWDLLFRKEIN